MGLGRIKQITLHHGPGSRFINRLDFLQRHGAPGNVHRPPVAVLIILPFPDKFGLHLRKRMRVIQFPAYVVTHVVSPLLVSHVRLTFSFHR